jgi:hypothetical protein
VKRHITAALLAVFAFAAMATAGCQSRSAECRSKGGTVTKETETEMKNGKLKVYTEYECMVGDQEVDEWRVG